MRYYARAFPPVGGTTGAMATLFNWFGRAHAYYFSLPRFKFEAMTLGLAVLFGLLVLPPLIYLPGFYILKPYPTAACSALYLDFFKGLVELRPSCWIALAGPFVFLSSVQDFPAHPPQAISKTPPGKRELVHENSGASAWSPPKSVTQFGDTGRGG